MTITRNFNIDELAYPSGPVRGNLMRVAYGELTLVGGVKTQVLPGYPVDSFIGFSMKAIGGVPGVLITPSYDGTTLTLTSSDALDTSTYRWILVS